MRNVLNMLDFIKAEIQSGQVCELVETLDVPNEVIVEIELRQRRCDIRWQGNARYLVLSKA